MPLIVIVDDRLTNRNIFAKLAAAIEEGIEVKTFGDPAEALVWLKDNTPHLVITDFKMPQMDGAEFIRRFRAQSQSVDIPVVVITVYEERSFRLRALEAGATDFLNSPVDHHEFVTRARNLLNLRKHQLMLADRADSLERRLEHSERSRERAMRDSFERLTQVIDTLPVMISAASPDGRLLFVNAGATSYFCVTQSQVIGQPVEAMLGEQAGARSVALDRMVFQTGKPLPSYEEEIPDSADSSRVFLTVKSPLRGANGEITAVLTSSLDITARKKTEANLRYMAQHDALTHLPNRSLLHERMRRLATRSRRSQSGFALHLVDLDGFKSVNDAFGHGIGDELLRQVAVRLSAAAPQAVVARLGGDEFALLLRASEPGEDAPARLAERLITTIGKPFAIGALSISVGVSIGVAHAISSDSVDVDVECIMRRADLALYGAKRAGKNRHCLFDPQMERDFQSRTELLEELRFAVSAGGLQVHYQPIVSAASSEIVGMEALLRWQDAEFGQVSPAVFVPIAEESGLILPLGRWVLHSACATATTWPNKTMVCVNVSIHQILSGHLPEDIQSALEDSGLEPSRLEIEITESIFAQDLDFICAVLKAVRELGVGVAIDDFGTGYSSLAYLRRLPADTVKIDRSFIQELDRDAQKFLFSLVTMARGLGFHIVAEGIETEQQRDFLLGLGVDYLQGFLMSKPIAADDALAWLNKSPTDRRGS